MLDEKDQVIVTTPLFNLENGYLTFYKGQVEIRNAYTTGGIRYIAVPLSGDGLSLAVGNYQTEVHLNDEVVGNLYWVIE